MFLANRLRTRFLLNRAIASFSKFYR